MPLCCRLCRAALAVRPHRLGACALVTSERPFTSRLRDALEEKVSESVEKLTKRAVFQDERMVTESRRKLERFKSAPETLAERLAAQRSVRRFLIPSDVKVDKSKMYIEFTWPEEALQAAATLEKAERAFRARQERASKEEKEEDGEGAPRAPVTTPAAAAETAGSSSKSTLSGNDSPKRWMRTRALAEYLRAYSTSTDGRYGMPNYPLYGRRGLTITDVYPVGNYALRVSFSDGHTGGLYSYEYLYFLTSPGNKYNMMRAYLAELRLHRKSRDPPKRAPSRRHHTLKNDGSTAAKHEETENGVGRKSEHDDGSEGGHMAPAFPKGR